MPGKETCKEKLPARPPLEGAGGPEYNSGFFMA